MVMDVTVTSVAKREQASSDAAAAVYVITREDIRRSGATSLPEVLRLAPGLQVARLNARAWAITARGFNSRFANKLLLAGKEDVVRKHAFGKFKDMLFASATHPAMLEFLDRLSAAA